MDPVEHYVLVMMNVVAEARDLVAKRGRVVDDVPDEDLLHGLLRLREAVARSRPAEVVGAARAAG